jgi:ABC-2 type transport system permease protein
MWLTVNFLGEPDNGVIAASYLGSLLMAGAFIAIGSCISALTRNQVVAFVVTVVLCLMFILSGFPLVLDFFSGWAPEFMIEAISSFSFLTHFDAISKGVVDIRDIIFFTSFIAFWLFANAVLLEIKKAG